MRFQYIILIILGIIFALMLGSFLFGISLGFLPQENLIKEINRLYDHRILTFFIALFLYGVSYVVTKTLIKRLTKEEIFIAETELGRVAVSMVAVEDVIRKVLRKFDPIKKYKLKSYAGSKKLNIFIRIKEWEGEGFKDTIEDLNKELKLKLDKIVGMRDNFEVALRIEKIQDPGWDD